MLNRRTNNSGRSPESKKKAKRRRARRLTGERLESRRMLAAETEWVSSTDDGELLLYGLDEFGNRLPDFSTVGFRGGTQEIPQVPTKVIVKPDGNDGDDSVEIQAAIDEVAAMPRDANGFRGAVLLRAGEYELEQAIEIAAGGIVLRGEYEGSPEAPELKTVLISAGSANHGVRPFRPVWPDDITTARRYDADRFSFQTDFIELSGSHSLHDLGVEVGDRVFFDQGSSFAVNYEITALDTNGFRFRIDQPLRDDISQNVFIGSSPESHSGGLVRVNAQDNSRAFLSHTEDTGQFKIVNDVVPVGARSLQVEMAADTPPLRPGDTVQLVRPGTREWVTDLGVRFEGEVERADVQGWTTFESSKYLDRIVTRVEQIADSDHYRITLDAPVTILLDQQYGTSYLNRYEWDSRITDVGIEYIRGLGHPDAPMLVEIYGDGTKLTRENHAWNFISVETARDVFVRHVRGEFFANAAIFVDINATSVTVDHAQSLYPMSRIAGNRRYAFESLGQKVLFRNTYAEYARHSFVTTGSKADLNVFVDSTARYAFAESGPHLQLNTGGLFDNVTEDQALTTRRVSSGEHGVRGASHVIWNSTIDYSDTLSPRLTLETDRGQYTLIPTDDSYTTSYNKENNGQRNRLPVRRIGKFEPHLMFDLSPIPDDAVLQRVELRLVPRQDALSVDGVYLHELYLLPDWDNWSEDTLNVYKDALGTAMDENGEPSPQGLFLSKWLYSLDQDAINIIFDSSDPQDSYQIAMLRDQLLDDRLTLRITPTEDAIGMSYYHSKEQGSATEQLSFIVDDIWARSDQRPIARNWLIGSSGAIDPLDLGNAQATPSSAENAVTLNVAGQSYDSLYAAQIAAREARDRPYQDYEIREYWVGDADAGHSRDPLDEVEVYPDWQATFTSSSEFDSYPMNEVIPFTLDIGGLDAGERIMGATLGLGLIDRLGISSGDSFYFESRNASNSTIIRLPFAHPELSWFRHATAGESEAYVLDLGNIPGRRRNHSLLDELSSGYLNVAVGAFTDVDWAVLNLKIATEKGFHRDLSGDIFYIGDHRDNLLRVSDEAGDLLVEDTSGAGASWLLPNVRRFHFFGMEGDDELNGFDARIPLIARGGAGHDRLTGGFAADSFEGGAGDDFLAGLLGIDTYVYDTTIFRDLGRDLVSEFSRESAGNGNELDFANASFSDFELSLYNDSPRFATHVDVGISDTMPTSRTIAIAMRTRGTEH